MFTRSHGFSMSLCHENETGHLDSAFHEKTSLLFVLTPPCYPDKCTCINSIASIVCFHTYNVKFMCIHIHIYAYIICRHIYVYTQYTYNSQIIHILYIYIICVYTYNRYVYIYIHIYTYNIYISYDIYI